MPKKGVHLVQTALLDSFVLFIPPWVLRLVLLDSMQMNQSLIIAPSVLKVRPRLCFVMSCIILVSERLVAINIEQEQWWHSGESSRLPLMWPGFDCWPQCHIWVDFVGSLLCSERFFPGYSGFPLSSKTCDFINLICTWPHKLCTLKPIVFKWRILLLLLGINTI